MKENLKTSESLIPNPIIANLRDLGGLEVENGGVIRPRCLLRSAALVGLSETNMDLLTEKLGPCFYVDLRTNREVSRDGGAERLVAREWEWHRFPIQDGNDINLTNEHERYRQAMPQYVAAARNILTKFIPTKNSPVELSFRKTIVIGCSLGKDRTGLVVALILRWLGVSEKDIAEDFESSNICLEAQSHLLLERWRDGKSVIGKVNGEACLAAIRTADLGCLPRSARNSLICLQSTVVCQH